MDRLRVDTPTPAGPPPERIRFGRFELQPLERRLLVDGDEVSLGTRAFDVLVILAEQMGSLVSRNELIERAWPGLVVEENNLSVQVHALRRVLGSDVVVTLPGHGYRLVACAEPGEPSTRSPALRTHLPEEDTPLLGRACELAELTALTDRQRLVTVTGAGGIGKTRLAQALMRQRLDAYRHGVCWIDLGPVRDAAALPAVVATALDLRIAGGEPLAALTQAAAGLEMLVALDNAEHLLDAVAELVQVLVDRVPRLSVLVTSQAPLRLAMEHVLHLGPLALPADDVPPEQAVAFGAVALFVERARAADSRFVIAGADLPRVIELCRRLDGLPLAIELAAARAPVLGVAPLLDALSGRLQLLTANRNRRAPPRQQTLRAALEWSHGLLGVREQRLFRTLAVLAGSASLAMVRRLACDAPLADGLSEWGVLDALDQLVQRSLVEVRGEQPGSGPGHPRYRLLESPRLLARERLADAGEEQALRQRHAQAVLAELEHAERQMLAGARGVDDWRRDGEPELADARQAIDRAVAADDAALAIALSSALMPRLPAALEGERQRLAALCEDLLERSPEIDPAIARRGWSVVGVSFGFTHPQRSVAAAMRALALARRQPEADPFVLYEVLCEAARAAADAAQFVQADAFLQEALALEDPRWPPVRLRPAARVASIIAAARGEPALALRLRRRVLELSLAAGDPSLSTRANIADLELQSGDAAAAVKTGRALVDMLTRLRAENMLALARINLAAAHLALSQAAAARGQLEAAWPMAQQMAHDAPACHAAFVDHVALLAALEQRHEAAALLIGVADTRHDRSDAREPNEAVACERACALATGALGAARFEVSRANGRTLPDSDIAELAFGEDRRPPDRGGKPHRDSR